MKPSMFSKMQMCLEKFIYFQDKVYIESEWILRKNAFSLKIPEFTIEKCDSRRTYTGCSTNLKHVNIALPLEYLWQIL